MKIFKNWTLRWWEMSLIKISLISFGILLGIYFHEHLVKFSVIWWVLFIGITVYFTPKIFDRG